MHPYLLEGLFLLFQLILEILCSVPQPNLIGCILTWRIRGIFCILDLLRKLLQFGILATVRCHHDASSGQRNTCRYVSFQHLQLSAAGRERDVLPSQKSVSTRRKCLRKCIICIQTEKSSCGLAVCKQTQLMRPVGPS